MSRQEGGWYVHRCVFLLKRMTRRLRRESGAYHFNGPLVNLLRQATQRGAGGMNRSSGKLQAELMAVQASPIVCFEERTPAFIGSQRFCRKNFTAEPMEWRTDYGAEAQVQPYGVLFCLGRRTEGVQGARKAPASINVRPASGSSPQPGLTRRLRRERWGCRPERKYFLFRSERKYQKKTSASDDYGKKAACPILTAGLTMSRAMELGSFASS